MTTPCTGKHELFDSRDPEDHHQARKLCASCPMVAECLDRLAAVRHDAHSEKYGPHGTWGGRLVGAWTSSPTRRASEDAMFTDAEARAAHSSWQRGDRSDRARLGERVYQRRAKRAAYARKAAA